MRRNDARQQIQSASRDTEIQASRLKALDNKSALATQKIETSSILDEVEEEKGKDANLRFAAIEAEILQLRKSKC